MEISLHMYIHVEVVTQGYEVLFYEDPGHFLHIFGSNAACIGGFLVEELGLLLLIHFLLHYSFVGAVFTCKMCQHVKKNVFLIRKQRLNLPNEIKNVEIIYLMDAVASFRVTRPGIH